MSLGILKCLPNPFSIISDDKGAQLPLRFEIFGLKSHILDNLGQLIAVLILIYFTRILFSLILKYFEAQRVRPAMKWWLDHTDEVFLFKMFETYQISITFAICLHLKYHSKEAVPTPENSIITGVVWIMVISIGVFYFWFALFLFATPQYEFEESKISIVVKHIEGYCMGYGWAFILLLMDQLFFLATYMLHNRPELLTACRIFLRIVTLVLILDMPFKRRWKNFQLIMNHIFLLIVDVLMMMISQKQFIDSPKSIYEQYGMKMIVISDIAVLNIVGLPLLIGLKEKYQARKKAVFLSNIPKIELTSEAAPNTILTSVSYTNRGDTIENEGIDYELEAIDKNFEEEEKSTSNNSGRNDNYMEKISKMIK